MNINSMKVSSKLIWNGSIVSRREFECANRLVDGLSAKEIAKTMNISPRTVEKYIESLKHKLNCRNQKKLILIILKHLQAPADDGQIGYDVTTIINSCNALYGLLINLHNIASKQYYNDHRK